MSEEQFLEVYDRLLAYYGPQGWWPADDPFEMAVGAVLTQNTNWINVAKAIDALRARGWLNFEALEQLPVEVLAEVIRPSGYYKVKATRLKNLFAMIREIYDGKLAELLADETWRAREHLLSTKGIGPETADCILLYGGNHHVFVVDAYTHRVFSRHGLVPDECDYHDLQEEFTRRLPQDWQLFNEYHALLVMVGKEFCKKTTPRCEHCPLKGVNEEK